MNVDAATGPAPKREARHDPAGPAVSPGGIRIRPGLRHAAWGLLALVGFQTAGAEPDTYTAGFFTRGTDAAYHVDSGDPYLDLFHVPARRLVLLPRVSLVATHDDNLLLDTEKSASGFVVHLIPGATLIWGRPESRHLYLDYGMVLPLYDESGRLDEEPSHLLDLGGVYQTEKSQLTLRLGYRRLENLDTLVGARIVKQDYIANAGLDHRVSHKSLIGVLGSYERHDFDADRYIDYERLYGAGRLYRDITPTSEMFLQGGIGRDELDTPDGYGDADFHDLSLGLRGRTSPKTRVSGRVGYMWRDYDHRIERVEHWIASLYAETTPMEFTTFSTEVYSDIRPAVNAAGSAVIDQRLTCSVRRRLLSERLRGQASILFGQVDYEGPRERPARWNNDFEVVYGGRRDEYWGYTLALDWRTRHNLSAGLAYSYIENRAARDADITHRSANSYTSGRWTLRLSWNY